MALILPFLTISLQFNFQKFEKEYFFSILLRGNKI